MLNLFWRALALFWIAAPAASWAQNAPNKVPPPLQETYSASDRDYWSLAFSLDGHTLAAGTTGGVHILAVADGKISEERILKQYGHVDELLFDSRSRILVSRSHDHDTLIWETDSWSSLKFTIEDLAVGNLALRAASQKDAEAGTSCLALAHQGRGLRLWNLDKLRRKTHSVAQADVSSWGGVTLGHVTAVAWSGTTLLAGDDEGTLYRLPEAPAVVGKLQDDSVVLGRLIKSPPGGEAFRPHQGEITTIALAGKAQRCVTAGMDEKVRLWDLQRIPMTAPARRLAVPKPEWEITGQAAELSSDGKLLAVANAEGVGVYMASSGIALSWNPTSALGGRVVRLRFDPEGKILAGVLCRCSECAGGGAGGTAARLKRRLADHGGALLVWK
jgi:WD40 repeat protein